MNKLTSKSRISLPKTITLTAVFALAITFTLNACSSDDGGSKSYCDHGPKHSGGAPLYAGGGGCSETNDEAVCKASRGEVVSKCPEGSLNLEYCYDQNTNTCSRVRSSATDTGAPTDKSQCSASYGTIFTLDNCKGVQNITIKDGSTGSNPSPNPGPNPSPNPGSSWCVDHYYGECILESALGGTSCTSWGGVVQSSCPAGYDIL
ncbi:MAG: hypothetical protein LBH25_09690 [Fibromonadaceae bacterium]|nr:hypothetical protein [Fibromonadaceae bacterium]